MASAWTAQAQDQSQTTSGSGNGSGTNPPIRNIYTFPPNHFIENIAVRSNSNLLLTSMSVPQLFSVDPTASVPSATVIHTFANNTGTSGIAEISPDVFAVVTAEWDLFNTRAILGTMAIWTVDFTTKSASPKIKFLTPIANSTIFNGIVRHPSNPRLLLAADSALGAVWKVDLVTGAYGVAFSSPLLQSTATAHLGINGIKALGAYVYFTNSAQGFLGRVKIDRDANQVGDIEVLASSADAGAADVVYDDIALDLSARNGKGDVWIASHPSYAVKVSVGGAGGSSQRVVSDAAKLLNPTAAAFGRGGARQQRTLYVTNGGEFVGADLINEGVVAIDLR